MRIAPVSSAMIMSARSRDPRLMRQQGLTSANSQHQDTRMPQSILSTSGSSMAKSLPRIPKFSQANNFNKQSRDNDSRNRDPRSRRGKEEISGAKSKSSLNFKDKNKSLSKSSSSRSGDRKKSGSSDDSSPRKKSEDEKKSSRSPSTHHRTSHSSSTRIPLKSAKANDSPAKDVDLRMIPGGEDTMKPDSTTSHHTKSNKDKLLSDLLNGEDMKSSHETITSDDNGKENKPILVVTISVQRFFVAIL